MCSPGPPSPDRWAQARGWGALGGCLPSRHGRTPLSGHVAVIPEKQRAHVVYSAGNSQRRRPVPSELPVTIPTIQGHPSTHPHILPLLGTLEAIHTIFPPFLRNVEQWFSKWTAASTLRGACQKFKGVGLVPSCCSGNGPRARAPGTRTPLQSGQKAHPMHSTDVALAELCCVDTAPFQEDWEISVQPTQLCLNHGLPCRTTADLSGLLPSLHLLR